MDTNDAEDMDSAALDKECNALSALFQQIINEMKVCHDTIFHTIYDYFFVQLLYDSLRFYFILFCLFNIQKIIFKETFMH